MADADNLNKRLYIKPPKILNKGVLRLSPRKKPTHSERPLFEEPINVKMEMGFRQPKEQREIKVKAKYIGLDQKHKVEGTDIIFLDIPKVPRIGRPEIYELPE